ncbi:uncharacterized protein CEXT_278131 [Caerostris extrusa]|uniref:Flagellar FliJ protein n=1 Tax=Caerostris extrusa TaxID=172846 RepID=A0AAV4Q4T7_CAEEX|nr:uncharacterized protein CEXT_278131 [Caerostris extrusa]
MPPFQHLREMFVRTYKDAKYLIEERNDLISKYEAAQVRNVELRKDIRAMERELYTMFQRNIHNSTVIDGLQPHSERLKDILNAIKLKNHQEAKKFKRELQDVSEEAREKDSEQKTLLEDNAAKDDLVGGRISIYYG